jgi:hypothetical protein
MSKYMVNNFELKFSVEVFFQICIFRNQRLINKVPYQGCSKHVKLFSICTIFIFNKIKTFIKLTE